MSSEGRYFDIRFSVSTVLQNCLWTRYWRGRYGLNWRQFQCRSRALSIGLDDAGTYLGQLLFAERTLGVVVQTSLQTPQAEGVTAWRRHWLIEKSAGGGDNSLKSDLTGPVDILPKNCEVHVNLRRFTVFTVLVNTQMQTSPHTQRTIQICRVQDVTSRRAGRVRPLCRF